MLFVVMIMIIIISIIFNTFENLHKLTESVQAGCFEAKQNLHYNLDFTNERMNKRSEKISVLQIETSISLNLNTNKFLTEAP